MTDRPEGGPARAAALLPAGLRDLLPPEAEAEAAAVAMLGSLFAAHGYERVEPPLLEFEDTLLAGSGADLSQAAFRITDPQSHRMMVLRPDMTPQVARIAADRLAGMPRPLRLAYSGACVTRQRGQLTSDRQIPQAGIELIGADVPDADAEVIAIAGEAIAALGLSDVSFDLTLPSLASLLVEETVVRAAADREALMRALDRKDAAEVRRLGGGRAELLESLLLAAGPAPRALACLAACDLPTPARLLCDRLEETVAAIAVRAPSLRLTIDPIEFRGWHYHTGVCVSLFSSGGDELGRGGRYVGHTGEPACGLTLFPASLLRARPPRAARPRLYVPLTALPEEARAARADGFATIAELAPAHPMLGPSRPDPRTEARRLLCTHLLSGGTRLPLDDAAVGPSPQGQTWRT